MIIKTGHLFAGAGGGLYADLILGHRPVFAVEWDNYAARCLQERADEGWFPGLHVHHGDVQLFNASEWEGKVDSLHAGFPCQDISIAGNGTGIEGERSGLWSEVIRVVDEIRVPELFLENSPAITSRGLGRVLGDLAKLGFDAEWCVLPASAFGAPHIRARWWCLARRSNTNSNGMQRFKQSSTHKKEWKKPGERQAGSLADGCGWWTTEPNVGRVVNGVANRGNRIKVLGNGQVPLQAAIAYKLLSTRFN